MNQALELLDVATSLRAAQSPGKDWKRYVETMQKAAETPSGNSKSEKVASPDQVNLLMRLAGKRAS